MQARGTAWYLNNLFVDPEMQGFGLGGALLERLFTDEMWPRFTCASTDPRALPLYVRAGMVPRWPYLWLRIDPRTIRMAADRELRATVDPDERAYLEWNAPYLTNDLDDWEAQRALQYLRVERSGRRIGSAAVSMRAPSIWTDSAIQIGPVIAHTAEDARDAMVCAVQWAATTGTQADRIVFPIPGPHPALPMLLAYGARITWTGTFCASEPLFDPMQQQFGED